MQNKIEELGIVMSTVHTNIILYDAYRIFDAHK